MARNTCTFFPDKIFGKYIGDICKQHDDDYAIGTQVSRAEADAKLFLEVNKRGLPRLAVVMFVGVRSLGWIFYGKTEK